VLKLLVGAGLGYVLFTNPGARQISAAALRAAADALAPEQEDKAFSDRVQDAALKKVLEEYESPATAADVATADASEGGSAKHQVPRE
jgi:hypothetical protein